MDPFEQADLHQYGMVYMDAECCGDSHRDNILDPLHTDVSIGTAYDDYTFMIVQNFENNYIKLDKPLAKRANYVELVGDFPSGQIHAINVHYDIKPLLKSTIRTKTDRPMDWASLSPPWCHLATIRQLL